MEYKMIGVQFELVHTKQTCPNYSVGNNQEEAEIQFAKLNTQEWCNCEKCEKMPTRLECMCCHEILEVKAFHLKCKARLSWNTLFWNFLLWNLIMKEIIF